MARRIKTRNGLGVSAALLTAVMTVATNPLIGPARAADDGDRNSGQQLLLVKFNGTTTDGTYRPSDDEIVDGTLNLSGGKIADGRLSLGGGTDKAAYVPSVKLTGDKGLTTDLVVEARLSRAGTADDLDTILSLMGNGSYRFSGKYTGQTTMWSNGFDEASAAVPAAPDWRFRHVALVYDYHDDGTSSITAYADGCAVATLQVGGALTPAKEAIGFGGEVHPGAPNRGLAATFDSIAAATYTGQFSTDDFQLPSHYEAPATNLPANVVPVSACDTADQLDVKAGNVTPTRRQLDWQRQEMTAFVHFGVNTFSDSEWGTGLEDPAIFNPTALDAKQWVETLKGAGFKTLILTVKHHDGFVLYPSRYTDHSVKASPWKNGEGDVLREVTEAAKAAGMGVGVYLSPADLHEIEAEDGRYGNGSATVKSTIPTLTDGDDRASDVAAGKLPTFSYDADDYNRYFLNQLYELLTEYGDINEVWFDGANPKPGIQETYNEAAWFDMIRKLQPEATIAVGGPDVRWVGNEAGNARETEWSTLPFAGEPSDMAGEMLVNEVTKEVSNETLQSQGDFLRWSPAEVDVSIRPGWFYHESQDNSVKSLKRLLSIYQQSVGRNSVLLLNVPPDQRGLIHENDAARLAEFGRAVHDAFDDNVAAGAKATSDVTSPSGHGAGNTTDSKDSTYWTPAAPTEKGTVTLDLGSEKKFNTVRLAEAVTVGERIKSVAVEAERDGQWIEVAKGTSVGYKRLLQTYEPVTARKVRVRILDSRTTPTLTDIGLFDDPNRPEPATYDSFAEALDNVGISNDNDTTRADFDGHGYSYSAQALAEVGITPGGTTTHDGLTFTWANVSPGAPDNVNASGQTIKMTGAQGSKMGFVHSGSNGGSEGEVLIKYTDGTVTKEMLKTYDWVSGDGDTLVTSAHRNGPSGPDTAVAKLFYSSVPLDPAKTVASITLPNISADATDGSAAMHFFAVATD